MKIKGHDEDGNERHYSGFRECSLYCLSQASKYTFAFFLALPTIISNTCSRKNKLSNLELN
jgi:hypothetical protein